MEREGCGAYASKTSDSARHQHSIFTHSSRTQGPMKRLSILTCIALLSGCGSSDLNLVKDGYMDFNQTSTIGQILDNWRSCESSEWAETVESNGVSKVVFSCTHKGFDEFAKTLKETIALKDEYFQEYFGVSS